MYNIDLIDVLYFTVNGKCNASHKHYWKPQCSTGEQFIAQSFCLLDGRTDVKKSYERDKKKKKKEWTRKLAHRAQLKTWLNESSNNRYYYRNHFPNVYMTCSFLPFQFVYAMSRSDIYGWACICVLCVVCLWTTGRWFFAHTLTHTQNLCICKESRQPVQWSLFKTFRYDSQGNRICHPFSIDVNGLDVCVGVSVRVCIGAFRS